MGAVLHGPVPRLAGRGAEQRVLEHALDEAASGRPRAVVVHGEAGVGKTRLVREVCQHGGGTNLEVLWGTCVRFGAASLPFAPVVGALQTWLARIDDSERATSWPVPRTLRDSCRPWAADLPTSRAGCCR